MHFPFFRHTAGPDADDLAAVARRGIEIPERNIVFAGGAGLLHLLALHGLEGILPFFELSCRQLEQHLLIRVAELPDEQQLVLFGQRRDAHAAVVADDLALCGFPVFKLHLVEQNPDDAAFKFCIAGERLFIELHRTFPFCAAVAAACPYYINIF